MFVSVLPDTLAARYVDMGHAAMGIEMHSSETNASARLLGDSIRRWDTAVIRAN